MTDHLQSRSLRRWIHIIFAACLGTYLYSPLTEVPAVELIVQVLVFPGLAVTGLLLWREPQIRQLIRHHRTEREH